MATKDVGETCAWCRHLIPRETEVYAVVANSSAVYPDHPDRDGQELVAVCNRAELAMLRDDRQRRFVPQELWARKMGVALRSARRRRLTPEQLSAATGLSREQLDAAIAWVAAQRYRRRGG